MGASETIAVVLGVAYWSCIMFLCGRFYQQYVDSTNRQQEPHP